jgi:hypothetical protein
MENRRRHYPSVFNRFYQSWGAFAQTLLHSHVKTFEEVCESLISESLRKGKVDQTSNQMAMNAEKGKSKLRATSSNLGKRRLKCSFCNKKGHIADKCWLKNPNMKNKVLMSETIKEKNLVEDINKKNFELYSLVSSNSYSEKHCLKNNQAKMSKVNNNNIHYKFYIDSGASCHMINDRRNLRDFQENLDIFSERHVVTTANGHKMPILGSGSLPILIKNDLEPIFLENVLYIPSLAENLISTSKLSEKGLSTYLPAHSNQLFIIKGNNAPHNKNNIFLVAKKKGSLFEVILKSPNKIYNNFLHANLSVKQTGTIELWHKRLSHPNFKTLKSILKSAITEGLDLSGSITQLCPTCIQATSTRCPTQEKEREPPKYLKSYTVI